MFENLQSVLESQMVAHQQHPTMDLRQLGSYDELL